MSAVPSRSETLADASWTGAAAAGAPAPDDDSGLQALVAAAAALDIAADARQIWHAHGRPERGFGGWDIRRAGLRLGLRSSELTVKPGRLALVTAPAIVQRRDGGGFAVLLAATAETVTILDPVAAERRSWSHATFAETFSRRIIVLARSRQAAAASRFGFGWFWPTIRKHAPRYRAVIVATIALHAFTLAGAKISEVVIDTVLVSRGLSSLEVLAIGLLGLALFDPLLSCWRAIIYAHVAGCVNSELSARLFRHLLSLPLGYFRARQSGDLIARVRELDQIRTFLTGSAPMTVLDLAFVGVFIAVMFAYAPQLTYVVLIAMALYFAIWLTIAPLLRRKVEAQYEKNAGNTAYLTEAVTGIETVKALAVGERFSGDFERHLAHYLRAAFATSMTGNWAGSAINLVQKCLAAVLLWFGVKLVMEGELSVGALVAFNALASHTTMPILRLAQIWPDFQHTSVSLRRLGVILGETGEATIGAGRSCLARLRGDIAFRAVTFRYTADGAEALRRLDLTIAAGETIGITGLSGSGKSTITKLIQRLYVPQSGQVLIDGTDLALADPATLRRQMGVVLQENVLFNGSIGENIALGNPLASPAQIERAAELAGALAFIKESPEGFQTQVGERGGLLSGGQRQRVALARALVGDPAILIMDEATSALDYESEAAIIERLPEIARGRTAIMIAHRLNGLRHCDRIIVLEHGQIIEEGSHDALLERGGRYAQLWALQSSDG